ncbi:hypothetical protein SMALA_8500 [Streptomyces malaysiensis subsp. malaysiensis]|nr:hypothetical protein SMALA_8500 [Streptomyces malaysiensis]
MRKDLGLLRPGDEIAVDLRTLTARRLDLVNDRTRQTNRQWAQLLEFFPALERALNLSKKGPVVLLTSYQVPARHPSQRGHADRNLAEEPQGEERGRAR